MFGRLNLIPGLNAPHAADIKTSDPCSEPATIYLSFRPMGCRRAARNPLNTMSDPWVTQGSDIVFSGCSFRKDEHRIEYFNK